MKSFASVSGSDFSVDLPQHIFMPEGTAVNLDDNSIPASWFPIEKGRNRKLYVALYDPVVEVNPYRTTVAKMIEVEEGSYLVLDLRSLIAVAINGAFAGDGFPVTSSYVKKTGSLMFSSTSNI